MRILFLLLLSGLVACSSNDTQPEEETKGPVGLSGFDEEFDVSVDWRRQVGVGQGRSQGQFVPAIQDNRLWIADSEGVIESIDIDSGARLWRINLDESLTMGVHLHDGALLLATANGELVSLKLDDGSENWRKDLASEIVALPATENDHIALQSVDGNLHLLSAETGKRLWSYNSNLPNLSLRGTSSPVIAGDKVIAGFASGKVVAISRSEGRVLWQERVGIPAGRSELERLVDVDGRILIQDEVVYAVGYQGHAVALDLNSGKAMWKREASSYHGAVTGLGNLYIIAEDDRIVAIDERTTNDVWIQPDLMGRQLTQPVMIKDQIAVADYEGYVHLVKQLDGTIVGRTQVVRVPTDWVRTGSYNMKHPSRHFSKEKNIPARLTVVGDTLFAYSQSGLLSAISVENN